VSLVSRIPRWGKRSDILRWPASEHPTGRPAGYAKQFLMMYGNESLVGAPFKAELGWEPTTTFEELVREMVQSDYTSARRDESAKEAGFQVHSYYEQLDRKP